MWFKLFYIVFLIAELLYGNFTFPLIGSPRILLSFIMLILLLLQNAFTFDKYTKYYMLFVLCYMLSSIATGDFSNFMGRLVRLYFIAIVFYAATRQLLIKYNGLNIVIYTLLSIGVVDAFVTIGQVLQFSIVNEFVNSLSLHQEEEFLDSLEKASSTGASFQMLIFPGLFGYVENAYILCVVSVLAFYNKIGKPQLWNWLTWFVIIVALACTQERTALIVGVCLSLFAVYRTYKSGPKDIKNNLLWGITLISLIGIVIWGYNYLMTHETRFAALGLDGSGRDLRYNQAIDYISDHLLEGGYADYLKSNYPPHNLFLLSLLYGGLFGCITICTLLYLQLKNIFNYLIHKIDIEQVPVFLFALAFVAYLANSLTHNLSVVSGDSTPWIIWGVIIGLTYNLKTK